MAIVGPLLFLLIILGIDVARMYLIRQVADSAAYEAARRALAPGATEELVVKEATRTLDLLKTAGTEVTVSSPLNMSVRQVTVRIEVPINQNTWLLPTRTTVTRECSLPREYTPGDP
jgi:hypothetical protein